MKAIHGFFVLFLVAFAVSCSAIYGVQHDYDLQADFKSLKTFDWMTVPEKANIDSLDVDRVKKAVSAELQAWWNYRLSIRRRIAHSRFCRC